MMTHPFGPPQSKFPGSATADTSFENLGFTTEEDTTAEM